MARLFESLLVDVGGVDFDPIQEGLVTEHTRQHHREGVGLFT
jgi:hypothetical protein